MTTLTVANELGRGRRLAPQDAAELADDAAHVGVQVDVLAYERGAPAVGAAVAAGLENVDATAQQATLEALTVPFSWPAH